MNNAQSDRSLGLLGLARRAGMLAVGEDLSGASARTGKLKVLFLARDASGNAERRARSYTDGKIPFVRLPFAKEELSRALGKNGCSMIAALDIGFAYEIVRTLEADGEKGLAEISAELLRKRDRARRRRIGGGSAKTERQAGMKGRKKYE